MSRPRLSYGLTIEQIVDFLYDCSYDDLMKAAVGVQMRRSLLKGELEMRLAKTAEDLRVLETFTPQTEAVDAAVEAARDVFEAAAPQESLR